MASAVKAAAGFTKLFADTQMIETPDRCIHVLRQFQTRWARCWSGPPSLTSS